VAAGKSSAPRRALAGGATKHFPYRISMPAILIWTAVVILGAVLATEAAGSRASRITVGEALAYL
jgi:ABC-type lipoprotein release transport system permease subunit